MAGRKGRNGKGPGGSLGLALLLALAALRPAAARAQEEVVRLGDLLALSNAGVYIAIEKGFFKAQDIRNDIATFASAGKMLPALTAGELDVSVGAPGAGLFNAIAQGAPYRVVADKGQARIGTGYTMLTVRKDLVDSGQVKSVRDLKGKRVSVFAKGITHDYLMGKMAEEVGLSIKDFDLIALAAPNQLTAFETKAIDAAITTEPWGARFEERKAAVRFRTPDQVKGLGPVQVGIVIYAGKFAAERHAVAQRWMNAYRRGVEYYNTKGTHDPEVLAILEKYTKVPAATIKAAIPLSLAPDGRPSVENLADQIRWFVANGYMPEAVGVDKVVDLQYLK
jgi:NitT/TauT family transport system substrate-binding protein